MSRQAPAVNKAKESRSAAVRAALARPPRRQLSRWRRERRQRLVILSTAVGLLAIMAVVLAFGYWREMIARPNEPAAVVGDEVIPIAALAQRVRPQLTALENEMTRLASTGSTSPESQNARQVQMLQNQYFSAPDQVLSDMIDEELIHREAQRRGLRVTPEEIDARIRADMAKQRAPFAPPSSSAAPGAGPTPSPTPVPTLTADEFETTYRDFLQRIHYGEPEYRAYTEAQLEREKLRDALGANIARTQEQVHARRLTVATQEEATAALAQIRSGEATFEDLAREKSLDLLSKSNGGDLGWLPRGIESAPFDETAFRLQPGEIGEPIVSPQGQEIVQVLARETRPLGDDHYDRLRARAMEEWLRQAREDPSVRRELTREKREWVMRQAGAAPQRRGPGTGRAGVGF